MLAAVFHLLVFVHHAYVTFHLLMQIDFAKSDDEYVQNVLKRFKWRYFTCWNFAVQIVYFFICMTEDFLRLTKRTESVQDWVRQVKDFIFTSLLFPGTLFVSSMFWGLYMIDRELVFPSALDAIMPSWTNHSTHTVISVALVVEMRITRHRYSKRSLGLAALALYLTVYDSLCLNAFLSDGTWIYPVYRVLDNWALRMLFFIFCTGSIFSFYVLGELLNSKLVAFKLERINEKLQTQKVR
ncbi:androgen-dependent TFPI-regulating protein isoform X1 [Cryptotermes secundus]|uniref:androgen-dependent TFPI-regulating protein isoform X1 n=1 Tax=Cryptotermes secundus TaxID=105785 RepID=UPI000CD7BC5E|nr:androgen-dependent TFPI-regulating protein isoform X1 [Cryptotermes secundus]